MSSADFLDDAPQTTYAEAQAAFQDLDVEQSALTRTRAESEMASFARLAREGGERDRKRILTLAWAEGKALGARAYYRLPFRGKGGGTTYVEGPTIQLTDALVNVWGDIAIQLEESQLDGEQLRLTVRVVDLRSGTMQERPHFYTLSKPPAKFRDNAESSSRWMAMQAQAAVSKAIRTTVVHALPDWLIQTALRAARDASRVEASPERIEKAVQFWAEQGVTLEQLVELVGDAPDRWSSDDLTNLRDLGRAVKAGDATIEEAFGAPAGKGARKTTGQPTGADALGGKKEPEKEPEVDTGLEVLRTQIRDELTALGAGAAKALSMQGIDHRKPVDQWPHGQEGLKMVLTFLTNWRKISTPKPEGAAAEVSREDLKTAIEAQVERLGQGRVCEVLVLDPEKWRPVSSWRLSDSSLAEVLAKLEAAEPPKAAGPVPPKNNALAARINELCNEIDNEAACHSALAEAGVPSVPWLELDDDTARLAITTLRSLRERLGA